MEMVDSRSVGGAFGRDGMKIDEKFLTYGSAVEVSDEVGH